MGRPKGHCGKISTDQAQANRLSPLYQGYLQNKVYYHKYLE